MGAVQPLQAGSIAARPPDHPVRPKFRRSAWSAS